MLAGKLEIEMLANMARLSRDMDDAKRAVGGSMAAIEKAVGLAKAALGGLTAGLSIGAIMAQTKSLIDAADAMNDMSQRVGVGVKDLAKYELAAAQSGTSLDALAKGIKGMAGNLQEHGDALRAAGITATTADGAMQQLADVFAAMPDGMEKTTLATKLFGKSGMDLIPMLNLGSEGLAEAATQSAVYADQMAALAPLADGFNDTLALAALNSRTVGLTLVNEVMPSLTLIAAGLATADVNAQGFGRTIGSSLNTVLQTAAVLVSDVGFVLKGMGREIGGIIAQFSAMGEGGGIFSAEGRRAWVAVGDAMKEDAARAREELDKWQAALLSGNAALSQNMQDAYNKRQGFTEKYNTTARDLLAALKEQKTAEDSAAKANKDRLAADEKAYKIHYGLVMAQIQAMNRLIDVRNKDYDSVTDYMAAESLRLVQTANASEEAVRAAQEEFDNHGKLKSAIAQTTLARLQDQLTTKTAGTEAYESLQRQIAAQTQLIAIMQGAELRAAAENAAEALKQANKKAAEESGRFWEDALMRAFESGKGFFESLWSTIKNTLKTQVLKIGVQAVMGTLGLGAASAAGAADGTLGLTSAVSALTNLPSAVSGLAASASAFWAGATASGATAAGAASAGLAYSGATAAGTGAAFSTGAGLSTALSAIPVWGWVAMAALAIFGMNKKTPSAGTGEGNAMFDAAGNVTDASSRYTGGWGLTDQVGTTLADLQASYAGAARALGIATVATEFAFGGNTGKEGKDPQFALGVNAGGVSYSSGEIKLTDANVQLAASRAVFAALQGSDLPAYLVGAFDDLVAASATQEQITGALNQASAVKTFHDAVQGLPFDGLKNLSFDASVALGQASGGLDVLVASLTDMQAASATARAGIAALVDGIDAKVSDSIFGMQYGMEDDLGKFNMLDVRAARLNDQMLASTDLAAVAKLAEEQIATINQAWGLLSAEQQRNKYMEFESRLNKVDDLVTARGADALSLQQAADDRTAKTIADAVEAAVAKALANPAAAMQAAADKADKPIEVVSNVNVNVTAPAGSEVSISQ